MNNNLRHDPTSVPFFERGFSSIGPENLVADHDPPATQIWAACHIYAPSVVWHPRRQTLQAAAAFVDSSRVGRVKDQGTRPTCHIFALAARLEWELGGRPVSEEIISSCLRSDSHETFVFTQNTIENLRLGIPEEHGVYDRYTRSSSYHSGCGIPENWKRWHASRNCRAPLLRTISIHVGPRAPVSYEDICSVIRCQIDMGRPVAVAFEVCSLWWRGAKELAQIYKNRQNKDLASLGPYPDERAVRELRRKFSHLPSLGCRYRAWQDLWKLCAPLAIPSDAETAAYRAKMQALGRIKGNEKSCHAVLITGYDTEAQAFQFKNSYGVDWKYAGFGWMRYDYLARFHAHGLHGMVVSGP